MDVQVGEGGVSSKVGGQWTLRVQHAFNTNYLALLSKDVVTHVSSLLYRQAMLTVQTLS